MPCPQSKLAAAEPATALVESNEDRGVRPDGWTAGARWKREADITDPVWFGALEALGGAGP